MMHPGYEATAEKMVTRILGLIPKHPEILSMDDPWQLFKVAGFRCDDIGPSLFQAAWALAEAKRRHSNADHSA